MKQTSYGLHLLPFCTNERQKELLRKIDELGGFEKACAALNWRVRNAYAAMSAIRKNAELRAVSPEYKLDRVVPEHLMLSGLSDMRENDLGKPIWYKFKEDHLRTMEYVKEFVQSYVEECPALPEVPFSKSFEVSEDIITWFQIGDAHLGMLAHEWEVGHNFDLKIAERELQLAMVTLIDRAFAATPAKRCVIQDLGDFTHYENSKGITEASGHALDVDGRFPKMIHVYARLMRRIVEHALSKFEFVDVIINQGNHSRTNDCWMSVFLKHVYEATPRLHVLSNSSVFIPYRMGNTFVLCHHTDKCLPAKAAAVMANDFAKDWGETFYHYIDGGHIHHSQVKKEMNGATYESWNNLAPADKWAHDYGYRSRACISAVFRSKTYGERGRITITAEEIKDMIGDLPAGTTANARRDVYSV